MYCYRFSPVNIGDYIILCIFIKYVYKTPYRAYSITAHYGKIFSVFLTTPQIQYIYNKNIMHLLRITLIMGFALMLLKSHVVSHDKNIVSCLSCNTSWLSHRGATHFKCGCSWVDEECNLLQWERKSPAFSHQQWSLPLRQMERKSWPYGPLQPSSPVFLCIVLWCVPLPSQFHHSHTRLF